jgi:enoyl-CoA hydratase/carnithine racemase
MTERVTVDIASGVADVRLARPEKRNALDRDMFRAIVAAAEQIARDATVRAVVLSGDGKAFCAGLDLSLFAALAGDGGDAGGSDSLRVDAARSVRVWAESAVPVIAAVHGIAYGGGLQLALGADLRIVAPDARLGLLEVHWGIVPDMGGTQVLPALIGPDRAKDLIFTGRVVDGEEAVRIGLATRSSESPRTDALALAQEIAGKSPEVIRTTKRLVDVAWTADLADRLRTEQELTAGLLGSANQLEAVRARLESREPDFTD